MRKIGKNSLILTLLISVVLTAFCTAGGVYWWQQTVHREYRESILPKNQRGIVLNRANVIVEAIKNRNIDKWASFIHPGKGVRFSPYAHVNVQTDRVFSPTEFKKAWSTKEQYVWGAYDGTGDPIKLTVSQYYQKFIYDQDFANAPLIGYNTIVGRGNTLNNILQIYPQAEVVEYHFPGFKEEYQGMDWRSLWLVLERSGEDWYLVGIAHDQWTI